MNKTSDHQIRFCSSLTKEVRKARTRNWVKRQSKRQHLRVFFLGGGVDVNINGDREHRREKTVWRGKTMSSDFMSYKWSFPKQRSSAGAESKSKYIMAV